jgi:hypothetical protein
MNKIALALISLVALALSLAGCNGQGAGGSAAPLSYAPASTTPSTPSPAYLPEGDDTIESLVSETSSVAREISRDRGGSLTVEGLTITIPSLALESDMTIKAAAVSVTDDGECESNSQCYQISTDSPEDGVELAKPATVTIKVDPSTTAHPELALWDGFEWITAEKSYDAATGVITFSLNYIGADLDQFSYHSDEDPKVHGPIIIEVMTPMAAGRVGTQKVEIQSSNSHFRIDYPSEEYRVYAETLGKYLEEGYTYYADNGFNAPVSYALTSPNETPYIKVEIFPSQKYTASANTSGIIRMPTIRATESDIEKRAVCFHELFHLVCLGYSGSLRRWPPDWIDESRTEAISYYGASYLENGNKESYYDIAGSSNAAGRRGFTYSLDTNASLQCYESFIFWSYMMKSYGGVAKFKEFVGYDRQAAYDLAWLDGMCEAKLRKSLRTLYCEAFEDYFARGAVFNKSNFCNAGFFPTRAADSPFVIADYTWWAFSTLAECNLYYISQKIQVNHCSGNYVIVNNNRNSASEPRKGTLFLSITNDYPDDVKFKAYRFRRDENSAYTLDGSSEVSAGESSLASFGTTWNVLYLLIENTSFTGDRSVNVRAYAKEE